MCRSSPFLCFVCVAVGDEHCCRSISSNSRGSSSSRLISSRRRRCDAGTAWHPRDLMFSMCLAWWVLICSLRGSSSSAFFACCLVSSHLSVQVFVFIGFRCVLRGGFPFYGSGVRLLRPAKVLLRRLRRRLILISTFFLCACVCWGVDCEQLALVGCIWCGCRDISPSQLLLRRVDVAGFSLSDVLRVLDPVRCYLLSIPSDLVEPFADLALCSRFLLIP